MQRFLSRHGLEFGLFNNETIEATFIKSGSSLHSQDYGLHHAWGCTSPLTHSFQPSSRRDVSRGADGRSRAELCACFKTKSFSSAALEAASTGSRR